MDRWDPMGGALKGKSVGNPGSDEKTDNRVFNEIEINEFPMGYKKELFPMKTMGRWNKLLREVV